MNRCRCMWRVQTRNISVEAHIYLEFRLSMVKESFLGAVRPMSSHHSAYHGLDQRSTFACQQVATKATVLSKPGG